MKRAAPPLLLASVLFVVAGALGLIAIGALDIDARSLAATTKQSHKERQQEIAIYYKSSGKPEYLARASRLATTWGTGGPGGPFSHSDTSTTMSLTFMLDTANPEGVETFVRDHGDVLARVRRVEGAENFGAYREGAQNGHLSERENKGAAFKSQRIKLRATFQDFAAAALVENSATNVTAASSSGAMVSVSAGAGGRWMCYLDDDMCFDVTNLRSELSDLSKSGCSPACFVGDAHYPGNARATSIESDIITHFMGGWCMERSLALGVAALLSRNTDEELGWTATDDQHFCQRVMGLALGLPNVEGAAADVGGKQRAEIVAAGVGVGAVTAAVNSPRWYSQNSAPESPNDGAPLTKGRLATKLHRTDKRKATWEGHAAFMESSFRPTLSMYHFTHAMDPLSSGGATDGEQRRRPPPNVVCSV